MRINRFAILLIVALLISGCNFSGPDADAIQTAIAETEESDTLRKIGTSLAEATIAAAAVRIHWNLRQHSLIPQSRQ